MPKGYRIAHVDIENFPNLGYTWEKYEQNVLDFERLWSIASFAVKWDGDTGPPTCYILPDFKRAYRNDPFDDSELLKKLHDIFDEADLIVGHNVDRFDIRKSNTRMMKHAHLPPVPYRTFDTLKEARKHFYFPSNKLGDLARFLGIGAKVEHEGFALWVKCMNGDREAWERMRRYNAHDVTLTQKVYYRLRPWSKSHPNITLEGGKPRLCPVCGYHTKFEGWRNLKSYRAKSYRCIRKSCGKTSQGARQKLQVEVLT